MQRRTSGIIVLLIAVSLSAVTAVLIRNAIMERRISLELSRTRARIQRLVAEERWADAADAIRTIGARVRPDADEWAAFLRLARIVEIDGGVDQLFRDTASVAFTQHNDSDRLRAIFAIAELNAGKPAAAAEAAAKLPAGEYAGVKAEAWLRAGVGEPPEGDSPAALMVSAVRDPSAHTLQRAWQATDDPSFGYNALLYALGYGDRRTARAISERLPKSERFAETMFVFLVEEGHRDAAERWLAYVPRRYQTASHILLTRADLALDAGEPDARRLLLKDVIDADPDVSSLPYLGLARMSEERDERLRWLREGHNTFPGQSRIALDLANVYRRKGDTERAYSVLADTHAEGDSEDARIALAMVETDPAYSSERRKSAKWELLSTYPESVSIAGHLAAAAVRSGDREGLSLIVATEAGKGAVWRKSALSIQAFSEGRIDNAIDILDQKQSRLWYDEYNLGLLLFLHDRFGDAASAWDRALESAEREAIASELLSDIYLRSAETALVRRRHAEARDYAAKAVEYDPGSARARMLTRFVGENR